MSERIILLADIHANDAALWAVIRHARLAYAADEPLRFWCLGDIFGRGPQPAAAWQRLRDLNPEAVIGGNHDWGLAGRWINVLINGAWRGEFAPADWQVLLDQRKELGWLGLLSSEVATPGPVDAYLAGLPVLLTPRPGVYLAHGGLHAPLDERDSPETVGFRLTWEYVTAPEHASSALNGLSALAAGRATLPAGWLAGQPLAPPTLALLGHAHRQFLCVLGPGATQWWRPPALDQPYAWRADPAAPVVLSPGSVGFPRERDSRAACYAALAHDGAGAWSVTFHQAEYDRGAVRQAMRSLGRPAEHIHLLDDPHMRIQAGAAETAA